MLIDETIYAEKRLKQFMSDTMVGSVKEDRRSGEAEVSSEVHQKATKYQYECLFEASVQGYPILWRRAAEMGRLTKESQGIS